MSDTFTPGEVYLAGAMDPGLCPSGAIAHYSTPDFVCPEYDQCNTLAAAGWIRPTDGRFIYMVFEGVVKRVREFHGDQCPSTRMVELENFTMNDPLLPTPRCSDDGSADSLSGFTLSADGDFYYGCNSVTVPVWYDSTNTVVYNGANPLVAVGHNRIALMSAPVPSVFDVDAGPPTLKLYDLAAGAEIPLQGPVTDLSTYASLSVRARDEGGFWVAVTTDTDAGTPLTTFIGPGDLPETVGAGMAVTLWEIDADGTVAKVADYPALPAGVHGTGRAALDGCHRLLQRAISADASDQQEENIIVRRDLDGGSSVVENQDYPYPTLQNAGDFISGP
jgi:hypothetical protein